MPHDHDSFIEQLLDSLQNDYDQFIDYAEGWITKTKEGQSAFLFFWNEILEPSGIGEKYPTWESLDIPRAEIFWNWLQTQTDYWNQFEEYAIQNMPDYYDLKADYDRDIAQDR